MAWANQPPDRPILCHTDAKLVEMAWRFTASRSGQATAASVAGIADRVPPPERTPAIQQPAISRPVSGNPAAPGPVPGPSPEPDSCRTVRQTGSVIKGRRSRSRSDAKGALDRFRLP